MGEGVLERHCLFPDELDSGLQLEVAGGRVSESPGSCSSFPATPGVGGEVGTTHQGREFPGERTSSEEAGCGATRCPIG